MLFLIKEVSFICMEQFNTQKEPRIDDGKDSKIIRPVGVISGKRKISKQELKKTKQTLEELKIEKKLKKKKKEGKLLSHEEAVKLREIEMIREFARRRKTKEIEKGEKKSEDKEEEREKIEGKKEKERKENELLLQSLIQARKEVAALESKKKRSKEEEEKLNKAREEYQKIRKYLLERRIKEMEELEEKNIKLKAVKFILEEQNNFIEEKNKHRGKWQKVAEHLLNNRIFQAYARIPKKYRWIGMSALGSAVLLGSGAGVAVAGAYFGLKLSKYIVGSLTAGGTLKAVQMFEEFYGQRIRKNLELKASEFFKKNDLELTLDNLIKEADSNLEKVVKSKKWTNRAKILAGIGGFFAGYELTDVIGHNLLEVFGLDHQSIFIEKGRGGKAETLEHKEIHGKSHQAPEKLAGKKEALDHSKIPGSEKISKSDNIVTGKSHQITGKLAGKKEVLNSSKIAETEKVLTSQGFQEQFIEVAQKGDSVWKLAEKALSKKFGAQWNQLDEAQKIYFIDALKDKVAANPEKFGLHTDNIDLIHPGDKINFSSTLNNEKFLNNVLEKAKKLSLQEKVHIISHIDWKKEVVHGREIYVSTKAESIGNVRVGFVDINHDYVPDKAIIINQKGEMLTKVDFKGSPKSLKDISSYLKEVKERAEEISAKYPPEILNNGEVFRAIKNNPKVLSQIMEIKNNFGIKDIKEAFSDYQLLTKYHLLKEHSDLLKEVGNKNWDPDQLKVLRFISTNYDSIKESQVYSVLDFSRHLVGVSFEKKMSWVRLYLDPVKNIDALSRIKPDIDLSKIKEIYWKDYSLIIRIKRKMWIDKDITVNPPFIDMI